MPSPLQGIELRQLPSKHYDIDASTRAFVPSFIEPSTTVTMAGVLRARIIRPERSDYTLQCLQAGVRMSLTVTVPWLDCLTPDFNFSRSFDVRPLMQLRVKAGIMIVKPRSTRSLGLCE